MKPLNALIIETIWKNLKHFDETERTFIQLRYLENKTQRKLLHLMYLRYISGWRKNIGEIPKNFEKMTEMWVYINQSSIITLWAIVCSRHNCICLVLRTIFSKE